MKQMDIRKVDVGCSACVAAKNKVGVDGHFLAGVMAGIAFSTLDLCAPHAALFDSVLESVRPPTEAP